MLDLFGDPLPEHFNKEYAKQNVDDHLDLDLQSKYKSRLSNLRRCWGRTQLYLPELMHSGMQKHRVFEMSTAHGGMLEVLRYFGHDVVGNDYVNLVAGKEDGSRALFRDLNDGAFSRTKDDYGLSVPAENEALTDWPYRQIIESIKIPMKLFGGGITPYPVEDKEFDVLLCMQAIEHYCHPRDWIAVLDEFCRITRKSIVLLLNPMMSNLQGSERDYAEFYNQAKLEMRKYSRNGFVCSSCHIMWGEVVGFKFTKTP